MTVREAQILGKPVMITDFETAKSQVENGVDGIICPMGAEHVANAVVSLLDDESRRKQLSQNCMSRNYSNTQDIKILYDFIEE